MQKDELLISTTSHLSNDQFIFYSINVFSDILPDVQLGTQQPFAC